MTASVLLHPRWIEPVMFLYDNSLDEINKNMDGFHAGSNFAAAAAANPCRNLMAHPAPLAAPSAAAYTSSEAPAAGMAEPAVKQCSPCSAAVQSSSGAALPYGYFGSGYYPCRMTHHNAIKSCAQPASTFADKYMDTSVSGEEFTSRAKEFAFYQGYAAGPYQPVPGYLDMPVVPTIGGPGEPRHDPLLPMDSYQPWAITNGWNGQVYCPKEQSQPPHLWKSTLPGNNTPAWLPGSPPPLLARPSPRSPRAPPGPRRPRPARAPRPQPAPAPRGWHRCRPLPGARRIPPEAPGEETAEKGAGREQGSAPGHQVPQAPQRGGRGGSGGSSAELPLESWVSPPGGSEGLRGFALPGWKEKHPQRRGEGSPGCGAVLRERSSGRARSGARSGALPPAPLQDVPGGPRNSLLTLSCTVFLFQTSFRIPPMRTRTGGGGRSECLTQRFS